MLLVVLGAITVSAYMTAINALGVARITISFFLATVLLAGTVIVIIQYVEQRQEVREKKMQQQKLQEMVTKQQQRLEEVKREMRRQLSQKRQTIEAAREIESNVTRAEKLASFISNVNLTDRSLSLNELMDRASGTRKRVAELESTITKLQQKHANFSEVFEPIQQGMKSLSSASQYFYSYYHAETGAQEQRWENKMRVQANAAQSHFEKARQLIDTRIEEIKNRDSVATR